MMVRMIAVALCVTVLGVLLAVLIVGERDQVGRFQVFDTHVPIVGTAPGTVMVDTATGQAWRLYAVTDVQQGTLAWIPVLYVPRDQVLTHDETWTFLPTPALAE